MSYDLFMFQPVLGEDPMDTLARLDEDDTGAVDPAADARIRRMADALLAMNPRFTESLINPDAVAEMRGIPGEYARQQVREILVLDEDGIEANLYARSVAITFPDWGSLEPDELTEQLKAVARVVTTECEGWQLYDPQVEKFVDLSADADEFREAFDHGRVKLREIVAEQQGKPRPRQSFWRRLLRG